MINTNSKLCAYCWRATLQVRHAVTDHDNCFVAVARLQQLHDPRFAARFGRELVLAEAIVFPSLVEQDFVGKHILTINFEFVSHRVNCYLKATRH